MLVVLVVHMRDTTPHVMYDFSHSVSGDTEVGVSDNCMQVKVMQDSDTGEGTSDEIASLCKGARHQVGDFQGSGEQMDLRCVHICNVHIAMPLCALCTYMQCAHRNAFMCIVHIICNVHCPLRTDSAYRGRFAGNIIRVESTEPLLAFQNPLKCL